MNEISTPWLNSRESAAYIGRKSKSAWRTLHQLAREGKIRAGHDGKTYRFKTEDLDAFLYLSAKEARQ